MAICPTSDATCAASGPALRPRGRCWGRAEPALNLPAIHVGTATWVVVDGRFWGPTMLYYADRRGEMLDPRRDDRPTVDDSMADPRYVLAVRCSYEEACVVIADASR